MPSSEIEIQSQVKGTSTVPDGLLESNFSVKLYVESKIKPNTINATQLARHQKQIVNGNDNVIIVAGFWAESVALNYNYYICQNKRSFKSARYLAFYNNNQIRHVFEIDKAPEDDINLTLRPEFATYLSKAEPSYSGDLRKVFTLKNVQKVGPND